MNFNGIYVNKYVTKTRMVFSLLDSKLDGIGDKFFPSNWYKLMEVLLLQRFFFHLPSQTPLVNSRKSFSILCTKYEPILLNIQSVSINFQTLNDFESNKKISLWLKLSQILHSCIIDLTSPNLMMHNTSEKILFILNYNFHIFHLTPQILFPH